MGWRMSRCHRALVANCGQAHNAQPIPHSGAGILRVAGCAEGTWGEQRGSLTFMVVVGGGEGALVDMVGQEAMEGVLKGGEGCLVVGVQDRALMLVQMLQEAVGGVRPQIQSWG